MNPYARAVLVSAALLTCISEVTGCNSPKPRVSPVAVIRTETVEFDAARGGRVRVHKTFRGDQRIMTVMTESNLTTRSLHFQGRVKYIEADKDGDGHFESVMLPGTTAYEFEAFRRSKDGTLEPLAEKDYLELWSKVAKATDLLEEAFRQTETGSEKNH